ncbi:MAG: M20/M25/M40 family metallo-hydrolase [Planctomycetota bacterium]
MSWTSFLRKSAHPARNRLTLLAVFASAHLSATSNAQPIPNEALGGITAPELGGHLRFLASELLEGRDTASRGERVASAYIAAQLERLGVEPAGSEQRNGGRGYLQPFTLVLRTPQLAGTSLTLSYELDGVYRAVELKPEIDFSIQPRGLVGGELRAPVVFAGHGIVVPTEGIDAYAGLDVRDRFVLVLDNAPADSANKPQIREAATAQAKLAAARRAGALGLLVLRRLDAMPRMPSAERRSAFGRAALSVIGDASAELPPFVLEAAARDFLTQVGQLDAAPGPRPGLSATLRLRVDQEVLQARNVIGLIGGEDPELRAEVVVFTAHYDHEGMNERGEIFFGADDNASGSAALLEIAEAFARGPRPRRSVAFLWVSGEEKGLLGSAWFVKHSTLPADRGAIVANINLDMVGRNEPGKVSICPSPLHEKSSSLNDAVARACASEAFTPMYDADSYFARTDSYNFALKGVPFIFLFSGMHEDYHKPTDTIEKVDFNKAAGIARIAFRLGWETANGAERPALRGTNSPAPQTTPAVESF